MSALRSNVRASPDADDLERPQTSSRRSGSLGLFYGDCHLLSSLLRNDPILQDKLQGNFQIGVGIGMIRQPLSGSLNLREGGGS